MSESKIVSLHGEEIPEPGTPNERVIEVLERSLEKAKAGDLAGVVLIQATHDDAYDWYITGHRLYCYTALGAVHSIAQHMASEINMDAQEC